MASASAVLSLVLGTTMMMMMMLAFTASTASKTAVCWEATAAASKQLEEDESDHLSLCLKGRQQIRDFCPDLDEQFFSLLKFEFYVKHVD